MGISSFKPSGYSINRSDYIVLSPPKPVFYTNYRCNYCFEFNKTPITIKYNYVNICDTCGKMFK